MAALDLETIYDTAPVGLAVIDTRLRFVRVNRKLAEMNGVPAQDHIGRSIGEIVPNVQPQAEAALRQVMTSGEPLLDVELHGTTAARPGEQRIWREQFHPLRDATGAVVGVSVVAMEITGERASQQALQQSQQGFREQARLLEQSQRRLDIALSAGGMGAWEIVLGSDHAAWSRGVHALLGTSPDQHCPCRHEYGDLEAFLAQVHPEDRAAMHTALAAAWNGSGRYEVEFRVRHRDGQLRWLLSRGEVVSGRDGGADRMIGVSFDITGRKHAEQALLAADAHRNEFLAMLAHELRNPLAPITNAVRLLERDPERNAHGHAATQILRRQTAHLARLVDDLLEVSRITQGRIELRMEHTSLAAAINQAVETVRPMVSERNQVLDVDVPPGLELVADPVRLAQVVSNLLSNAVKYTHEGGRVQVAGRDAGDDRVEICVRDNGPGIPAELLPDVFALFTQGKRTLDRSQGGLGIGLALVRRLVEMHGGTVQATSAGAGQGASFTVLLPRQARRARARDEVGKARGVLAPLSVLVVDDNVDAARSLAMLLELDGHAAELAFDGEQALSMAARLQPDVVLLDIGLPRLDGLAVARRLRESDPGRRKVIVAVSGYALQADRDASRAAGFDGHLSKPVELQSVYRLIERTLQRPSGPAATGDGTALGHVPCMTDDDGMRAGSPPEARVAAPQSAGEPMTQQGHPTSPTADDDGSGRPAAGSAGPTGPSVPGDERDPATAARTPTREGHAAADDGRRKGRTEAREGDLPGSEVGGAQMGQPGPGPASQPTQVDREGLSGRVGRSDNPDPPEAGASPGPRDPSAPKRDRPS